MKKYRFISLLLVSILFADPSVNAFISDVSIGIVNHTANIYIENEFDLDLVDLKISGFNQISLDSGSQIDGCNTTVSDTSIMAICEDVLTPGLHILCSVNFDYFFVQEYFICIDSITALLLSEPDLYYSEQIDNCIIPSYPDTSYVTITPSYIDVPYMYSTEWSQGITPLSGYTYHVYESPDWVNVDLIHDEPEDYLIDYQLDISGAPGIENMGNNSVTLLKTSYGDYWSNVPYEFITYQFQVFVSDLLGDLNQDGEIAVNDIVILIEYILSDVDDDPFYLIGDINGDGAIDILDIVLIVFVLLEF